MRRLSPEGDLAVRGVEVHAVADEIRDAVGGFEAENARRFLVDQASASLDGVAQVILRRVARPNGSGDAALGVARARLVDAALGHHEDARTRLVRRQRGIQPGDAGADDDEVITGVTGSGHRLPLV